MTGGVGSSTPIQGGGGAAGAGGTGGDAVVLEGTVTVFRDDRFGPADPLAELASVTASGADGALVATTFDGVHPFELPNVAASELNWVAVQPLASDLELLAALHPVDTRPAPFLSLSVARVDTLSQIYATVTAQTTVALDRGHILLFFRDTAGHPVSGVQVSSSGAELVAYATGETWDTTLGETSSRGIALLGNVPAGDFPGADATVSTAGALSGGISLRVAAGTLTVSEVVR